MAHLRFPPPLALIALLGLAPGCSYFFTKGPPANHASLPDFECSINPWAPSVDTVATAFFVLGPIASQTRAPKSPDEKRPSLAQDVAIGAAGVAIFGTAAVLGTVRGIRCAQARAELIERPWTPEGNSLFPPRPPPLPRALTSAGPTR